MTFEIRAERPDDRAAIRQVHDSAFGGPVEGRLVDLLREAGDLALSLVAMRGNAVIAHIAFSPIDVTDGAVERAVALAPVAVMPDEQGRGVGGALIEQGLKCLAERGERLVFVLGDPAYYGRFGFSSGAARGFDTPWPGDAFMALWLETPLPDAVGVLHYAQAFQDL